MKKLITLISAILVVVSMLCCSGCLESTPSGTYADTKATIQNANTLQENQPTPTDIDYSLERYNLIRRTYWVNGQREKANTLPCAVEKPLGYILLMSSNVVVGKFVVDGKVSSLNSFLTPDSEFYEYTGANGSYTNRWLADVDGSYGANDNGIFFFTVDGKYVEWTGTYLYSDIPFEIENPILQVKE